MIFIKLKTALAMFLMLSASLVGCGGGNDHGETLAPVSGTVTFDGKPLVGAMVAFVPVEGGRIASGKTNEQGVFELTTYAPQDGAIVGQHKVRVVKTVPPKAPDVPVPNVGEPLIPAKYLDASTSGLTAEVVEGSSNDFEFNLTE